MSPAAAFPWRAAMAVGLGRLGLGPAAFWSITPRELAAILDGLAGSAEPPIGRAELDRLAARYPDCME